MACHFKTPVLLSEGLKEYIGDAELKKSRAQIKKEEEIRRRAKENEDLRRRLNKNIAIPQHVQETDEIIVGDTKMSGKNAAALISSNCVFSVFDRIKIKVRATDTFPMEIASSLLITQEDIEEYESMLSQ